MFQRYLAGGVMFLALVSVVQATDKPNSKAPHAGLERMKKLAGTWVKADKDGKPTSQIVSVIKLIGAGSTVHETLFPGEAHEMVSVYHLDKGELLMTHYCALGNQPRMKADPASPANQIHFKFAGGTNFDPAKDKHMHEAILTFVDANTIRIKGSAWEGGKPVESCCEMTLVRKK